MKEFMDKLVFFDGDGKVWRGDIAEACALYVADWVSLEELDYAVNELDDVDKCQFVQVISPGFYVWVDVYNQFIRAQDIQRWAMWTDRIESEAFRWDRHIGEEL